MRQTGLGIGRGIADPAEPDACIVAAWLLSGGIYGAEYLNGDPNRAWLIEAARIDANAFQSQLARIADKAAVLEQLRRVDHLLVRDAYQAIQAAQPWRPSVREDIARAERTRQFLAGELVTDTKTLRDDG